MTNSALSNYWEQDREPTKCKAAFVDGRYVPGCDYGSDPHDEAHYGDIFKDGETPQGEAVQP